MEPLEELRNAGQNLIAVIDHAVHVADKALFLLKINGIHSHFLISDPPYPGGSYILR